MIVIFQGFDVFTRHNAIWEFLSLSWGYTIAPWIIIATLFVLFAGWLTVLVYRYTRPDGKWEMLEVPTTEDVIAGISVIPERQLESADFYERWKDRVLNYL